MVLNRYIRDKRRKLYLLTETSWRVGLCGIRKETEKRVYLKEALKSIGGTVYLLDSIKDFYCKQYTSVSQPYLVIK